MKPAEGSNRCTSIRLVRSAARSVGLVRVLPALVSVELLDEFRFSVFLQTLSRVELPIAMLTESQGYRRKPDDSKFAMRHCPSVSQTARVISVPCRTMARYERDLVRPRYSRKSRHPSFLLHKRMLS